MKRYPGTLSFFTRAHLRLDYYARPLITTELEFCFLKRNLRNRLIAFLVDDESAWK